MVDLGRNLSLVRVTIRGSGHFPSEVANGGVEAHRVEIREQEQAEDARIERDPDGGLVLCLRTRLISPRAYVAIGLALADLVEQSPEYLYNAG